MTELSQEARGMVIKKLYENWENTPDEEYVQYLSAFLLIEPGPLRFIRMMMALYLHCAKHDTLVMCVEDIQFLLRKYVK